MKNVSHNLCLTNWLSLFFSTLLILIASGINGQITETYFSGTVYDAQDQKPIPYATVYINGTTIGCLSNEKGEFKLSGLTYPCKIIVSQVGYTTKTLDIDKNMQDCWVSMELKIVELTEVTIESKSTDDRSNNLLRFKAWFIGSDYWGRNAELLNDSVLIFYRDILGFHAKASAPLEINLSLLGYKLKVDLIHFQISNNMRLKKEQCFITAYYYYIPVDPKTRRAANNIARNRLKAYYCSELHFCRSLYQDSLSTNGYQIKKELKSYELSVFNPSDLKKVYVKNKTNQNSMLLLGKPGSGYIIYYYQKNGMPMNIKNLEKKPKPKEEFISRLYLNKDTSIIRENGTVADYSLMFEGLIGDKSVGAMLPDSYYPNL